MEFLVPTAQALTWMLGRELLEFDFRVVRSFRLMSTVSPDQKLQLALQIQCDRESAADRLCRHLDVQRIKMPNEIKRLLATVPQGEFLRGVVDEAAKSIKVQFEGNNVSASIHVPLVNLKRLTGLPKLLWQRPVLLSVAKVDPAGFRELTYKPLAPAWDLSHLVYCDKGKSIIACSAAGAFSKWDSTTMQQQMTGFVPCEPEQAVVALEVSEDGKLGAAVTAQYTYAAPDQIFLFEPATGKKKTLYVGTQKWSRTRLALSRDGRLLAACIGDESVRVWDTRQGQVKHVIAGYASSIAFSPDAKTLAVGGEQKHVKLLDMETGKVRMELLRKRITDPLNTPFDGVEPQDLELPLEGGKVRPKRKAPPVDPVRGLAFSANGKSLSVACGPGTDIYDLDSRALRFTLGSSFSPVHFSSDGKLLLNNTNGEVYILDNGSGELLAKLTSKAFSLRQAVFSPDGRALALLERGSVRLWALHRLKEQHPRLAQALTASADPTCKRLGAPNMKYLQFSPDSKQLIAGVHGEFHTWNISTAAVVKTTSLGGNSARLSQDGKFLLYHKGALFLEDVAKGTAPPARTRLNGRIPPRITWPSPPTAAALSATTVLAGSRSIVCRPSSSKRSGSCQILSAPWPSRRTGPRWPREPRSFTYSTWPRARRSSAAEALSTRRPWPSAGMASTCWPQVLTERRYN